MQKNQGANIVKKQSANIIEKRPGPKRNNHKSEFHRTQYLSAYILYI